MNAGTATDVAELIQNLVLPKLEGARRHGSYWMAFCPAHPNVHTQALQVGVATKGVPHVLFTCHAGCPREQVIGSLGLTWGDLYLRGNAPERDHDPVAEYIYRDRQGQPLYKKVKLINRKTGGKFCAYSAYRNGQWVSGEGCMTDVRRVPFRLPQLLAAKDTDAIFYVEGEKDAMALASIGEIATTAGGVNDWKLVFSQHFRGKDVLIVADKDDPGYKHAIRVRRDLKRRARFAWIIQAREGKDASDHIRAGYGVCDFDWLDIGE